MRSRRANQRYKTLTELFHIALLKMFVIGLVICQLVFGESFQYSRKDDLNGNLFNFTSNQIIGDYIKSEGLIKDKCILKLLKEAVNEFGSTYMFITDDHYHDHLLHNLEINFVHSYFTEPEYLTVYKSETYYDFLIFGNKFQLREVIRKKQPVRGTKFFILVKNYQEAIEKFEILWENRLVNVVASYLINNTAYYYTYFPYCASHCNSVGKPYLLGDCDISNGLFSRREKLYPRKVHDLHNCPVNITFTENIPSSYYMEGKRLTGWEIDLLNEILQRINGVPNYNILNNKNPIYQTLQGYRRLVENSEIGLGLVVSLKGLMVTDFCLYGMSFCSTWAVPQEKGSPFSVDFLIKVFPTDVWILLFLIYIIMATTIWVFFNVGYCDILFKLLAFLFGTTTHTKRTSRILGGLWLWFCLVMDAVYQSGFQSTLLVPNLPNQLSNTQEILKSNLKILGVTDVITDATPYFKERYNLSSRRFRNRKLSYEDWVYRMAIKKDSAFLGFKEIIHYYIKQTKLEGEIYTSDGCVIKYLLAFVLKKNSHLTDIIVTFSNRLNENGFVEYFVRKHLSKQSRLNAQKKMVSSIRPIQGDKYNKPLPPVNLDKISVVFMCLASGILLALAAFIMEIMSTRNWKRIKKNVLRELQQACPCK